MKLFLISILMLFCLPCFSAKVRMYESPGRGKRTVEVGDMFYIYVEVSDLDAMPEMPKNIPGAKLMYFDRTGQTSSFTSINGRSTQSFSYTYTATLRAQKEGTFTFGPISVGGVKSNTIKYSIGKQSASSQSQGSGSASQAATAADNNGKPKFIGKGDGNLFLKANVSSTNAYEQQALVYTVKLYTTYDAIKFIGASAAPKFEGFVIEESKDISSSFSYETYQGKTYATAVIARYIIFPQMTGSLKVTGNTYTVSVDRREYYHDPFFGNMSYSTPLQLNVTPNDLVINVKSLPFPKPADFSGAVGTFSITSHLKSNNLKSNQAGAIVYDVKGTGNIKYVQLPDMSALYPPEIEIYTPTTKQNISIGSTNVSGTVTFDYSFMPLEEGNFRIPDVKLVYFNPVSEKYETAVAKGYDIHVAKGKAVADKNRVHLKFDSTMLPVNSAEISKTHSPWINSFLYWLFYIVPAIGLLSVAIIYRRYVSSRADMAAFNSRHADKFARRRLKKAEAAMKKNNRELFYDELLTAMWGYLGDKLKMPNSELMRDNVRQVLGERGVPESDIDEFIKLIDDAEFAKYSSAGGGEDMKKAYLGAIAVINRLNNNPMNTKM
ncbi:MAG: BatD family protein [Candidatus Amulumruptor caecigallinarius]|nr:BatD family protein [Candidatus Amulumruptor caecigallinarius]